MSVGFKVSLGLKVSLGFVSSSGMGSETLMNCLVHIGCYTSRCLQSFFPHSPARGLIRFDERFRSGFGKKRKSERTM